MGKNERIFVNFVQKGGAHIDRKKIILFLLTTSYCNSMKSDAQYVCSQHAGQCQSPGLMLGWT
jgi:hypothetical protein